MVLEQYGGMLPQAEVFYLHSIVYSARRCLHSFDEYEGSKHRNAEAEYLVSVVQEAIGHAAALSRYFWPSSFWQAKERSFAKLKERRAEKLRDFFALARESPLHNRDLRNAWEHFDERLDAYLLENDTGYFFPSCQVGSHDLADDPVGHIFKLLDPSAECLVLLGSKYFFGPIRREVSMVLDKAVAADATGGRLFPANT